MNNCVFLPPMDKNEILTRAKEHFGKLVEEQLNRVEQMKNAPDWISYTELKPIIIAVCPGDGIGPEICKHATMILKYLLETQIKENKIEIRNIEGLTIENRVKVMKAIPEDVLQQLKQAHIILKGPTTTPQAGDPWPNIESANVAMRRELDLFANIRPVKIPKLGIDWIFFRENTEDLYVLGSKGIDVTNDLTFDFKVITEPGCERILKMAFEYAKNNKMKRVTVVTKSNVVKKGDGRFSRVAKQIAHEYEKYGITVDEWYIDIMTAKLIDPARQKEFQIMVMPNLYGDILTDEAAQIQGGVGTAGSANIGKRWAMFEAIHGSAPRMVKEGRTQFADPSSIIKASAMLLRHIGFPEKAEKLEMALDICSTYERKIKITSRADGATGDQYTEYLMNWIKNPNLESEWKKYTANN